MDKEEEYVFNFNNFAYIICACSPIREVKERMERENQERQREQEELRAKMEREKGELEKQLEVGNKGLEEQGRGHSNAQSYFSLNRLLCTCHMNSSSGDR